MLLDFIWVMEKIYFSGLLFALFGYEAILEFNAREIILSQDKRHSRHIRRCLTNYRNVGTGWSSVSEDTNKKKFTTEEIVDAGQVYSSHFSSLRGGNIFRIYKYFKYSSEPENKDNKICHRSGVTRLVRTAACNTVSQRGEWRKNWFGNKTFNEDKRRAVWHLLPVYRFRRYHFHRFHICPDRISSMFPCCHR